MTITDFNNLKIGDFVYLPNGKWQKNTFTSTEVLAIDKYYKKIKVLLRSKFLSYKFFPKKVDFSLVSCCVGVCKGHEF